MAREAGGRTVLQSRAKEIRDEGKTTFENILDIFGGAVEIKFKNLRGEKFFRVGEVLDEIINTEKCEKSLRHFEEQNRRGDVIFRENANHFDEILGDRNGLESLNFGGNIFDELFAVKVRIIAAVDQKVDKLGGLFGIGIEKKFANKVSFVGVELKNQAHVEKTEIPCLIEINIAAVRIAMKNYRKIMEEGVKREAQIIVDGAGDLLLVVGRQFKLINSRVRDELHDDNILRTKVGINFWRDDVGGVFDAAVDTRGKLSITSEILALLDKVGFLVNPVDVIFECLVAAEKIAEFGKAAEAMDETANLLHVTLDAVGDVGAFNFHGDDFARFQNGAMNLGNGSGAERLFVDRLENFVEWTLIFLLKFLTDFRERERVTMVTNRGELRAILLGEDIADVLHGENLSDFNVDDAHTLREVTNHAAGAAAQEKLLNQHQTTVKIKPHRF